MIDEIYIFAKNIVLKHTLLYIVILFLFSQTAFSRVNDPPVVTCLDVHENGEVTIYWQSLDLSALEFRIYYSIDEVTWAQAGSVDTQNQSLSFTHTLARADTAIYYYYIKAIYPTIEDSSGVFRTIFLDVISATAGEALLFWNSVSSPLPQGSSTYYKIYKSIYESGAAGPWQIIDSTENTSYNYIIDDGICDDSINFKIEISNTYSCTSVSNIAGDRFSEENLPDKPVLDSVSIVANDNIILGWDPVSSPDVAGIIIYRKVGNSWPDSTTVLIPYTTFYEDTTQYPCTNNNIIYAIASIDSCGNKSPKTELTAQRPIFFNSIDFNLCLKTNYLSWEHYINALAPFDKYEIWASINGGTFTKIDEVPSTENNYNHVNIENSTNYSYFVRAVFGEFNFTSTSCTKSITTGNFIIPDSVYLANATILPNFNIELTIDVDLKPHTCTWEIFRSDAGGGTETLLTTLNRSDITTSPTTYVDETADGSTGFYTYSVAVFDSCGAKALQSNTLKTIYLQGQIVSNIQNKLSWNPFEGFDGDIDKYYIFRMLGEVIPTTPIDSTNAQTTEYTDDISNVEASESEISYWVQASEKIVNIYGYKEKSNSNIINMFREISFYFPNAFRPKGTNNTFKPVSNGFGGFDYLFQIYNRWGQLIFETTDFNKGWDGTYNGITSPQGTYVYRLVYKSVFDATKQQRGIVTLIN